MSTLLGKLLNRRDSATFPSREELRQHGRLIRGETARLSSLAEGFQQKLQEAGHFEQAVGSIESRLQSNREDLQKIEARMSSMRSLVQLLESLDQRLKVLDQAAAQADQRMCSIEQRKEDAEKAGAVMRELIDVARQAQQKVDSLRMESGELEKVESEVKALHERLQGLQAQLGATVLDLENLQNATGSLRLESQSTQNEVQQARSELDRLRAAEAEIESARGTLSTSQTLARKTEEQLRKLNVLSELVSQKINSLNVARELVERANAQCAQVNELVWEMERKVKYFQGEKDFLKDADGMLQRLQELQRTLASDIQAASREQGELLGNGTRLRAEIADSLSSIREQLEKAAIFRQELEVANGRVMALHSRVNLAEDRFEALAVRDQDVLRATKNAERLVDQLRSFEGALDSFGGKVQLLGPMEQRLDQLEGLSSRVGLQIDEITRSRTVVEDTAKRLSELLAAHGELQSRLETMREARQEVELAHQQLAEFRKASLATEATIQQVTRRLDVAEQVNARLATLQNLADRLEVATDELKPRLEFVEGLESRVNRLGELSRSIDARMEEQLGRNKELESMQTAQESLAVQFTEIQSLVTALKSSSSLNEMEERTGLLEARLQALQEKLAGMEHLERATEDRERRNQVLVEKLEEISSRVERESGRLGTLDDELQRANRLRQEWLVEATQIEARQRELGRYSDTSEAQLQKIGELGRRLEERMSELAAADRKLAQHEEKVQTLEAQLEQTAAKIEDVHSRQASLDRIGEQMAALFETCERTRNHALAVVDARKVIVEANEKLSGLFEQTKAVDERHRALEARHGAIEEAELKIDSLRGVLGDIEVNLENFTAQKVVIDHLAEKLARLDFATKKAEIVARELQEERELGDRILKGIQSLRETQGQPAAPATVLKASSGSPQDA